MKYLSEYTPAEQEKFVLTIFDNDVVEEKNVYRQNFNFDDVGSLKVKACVDKHISMITNPNIIIRTIPMRALFTGDVLNTLDKLFYSKGIFDIYRSLLPVDDNDFFPITHPNFLFLGGVDSVKSRINLNYLLYSLRYFHILLFNYLSDVYSGIKNKIFEHDHPCMWYYDSGVTANGGQVKFYDYFTISDTYKKNILNSITVPTLPACCWENRNINYYVVPPINIKTRNKESLKKMENEFSKASVLNPVSLIDDFLEYINEDYSKVRCDEGPVQTRAMNSMAAHILFGIFHEYMKKVREYINAPNSILPVDRWIPTCKEIKFNHYSITPEYF